MIRQYKNEELHSLQIKEIPQRTNKWELLIIKLKEIFKEYFYELYDFFLDIMKADYDYKFLIARRCLVLYEIFFTIFEYLDENVEIKGEILSDRIIPEMKDSLFEKRVLLIDDILIHGRRVNAVHDSLMDIIKCEEVDMRVYMATTDKKCMRDDILMKVQFTELAEGWKWKSLSDAIVRAIYVSNMPYTSFVPAINWENEEKGLMNFEQKLFINSTSVGQKIEGCISKVLINQHNRNNLFCVLSYKECIRIYKSKVRPGVLLIPYCFTRAIRADKIDEFFIAFSEHISLLPTIAHVLKKGNLTWDWNVYRMNLLNALLSQLVGIQILRDNYIGMHDYNTLAKSFGENIALEFLKINCNIADKILGDTYNELKEYISNDFKEEEELENIYKRIFLDERETLEKKYEKYLYENRILDEKFAVHQKDRLTGLSIDFIYKSCLDKKMYNDIVVCLIKGMDTGCASVSYKLSKDKEAYVSVIQCGEQSYRIILERYSEVIRYMIVLEENNLQAMDFVEYLENNNVLTFDQSKEIRNFYNYNDQSLENCNVVEILENSEFWTIPNVKEAYIQFINQGN